MSKSSHLLNVFKQAMQTFATKKHTMPETFSKNLQDLIFLLDKTTAEHVNFHSQFMDAEFWNHPGKAPVSCIEICENDYLTMGIFILKPNGKLPLHNHPQMHGLIKVIAGQVKIVSYSINTEKIKEIEQKSFQECPKSPFKAKPRIITAELNEVITANTTSSTCILDPDFRNIHEIQSVDGPAAFLDILAPPYDYSPDYGTRKCSYYSKLSQVAPNIFRLEEIRSPSWYWTDPYPYDGPDLEEDALTS